MSDTAVDSSSSESEGRDSGPSALSRRRRQTYRQTQQRSEEDRLQHFCRGSIKRLKKAGSKVNVAKKDMEQILEQAKVGPSHMSLRQLTFRHVQSESDLPSLSPSSLSPAVAGGGAASSPQHEATIAAASLRLAEDTRLAVEAQQEMRKIICQFADLLRDEEERVAVKADLLHRRSSQIRFEECSSRRNKGAATVAEEEDGDEDGNDKEDVDGNDADGPTTTHPL